MIDVEALSVSLGGVDVLDDISLSVSGGEFVGLVGPNGAGKTTLLQTINGALEPDEGTVHVGGEAIAQLSSRAQSRRVATVPQDTSVRFAFRVEDVVAMGRTPYMGRFDSDPGGQAYVDSALRRTDTEPLRDRRISTLSGGERQRVFLARALAQDSDAMVLDEPTASLDVNHATRTLSLVRDLVADDRAVIGAIHDLEAAARFCDRLVMLADGAVLAAGPPAAVLTSETLAGAFDTQGVVTENLVTGSPTVTALPTTDQESRSVHVLGGGTVGAQAIARLHAAGHEVTAGPYSVGDAAITVADSLDVPVTTVPPLERLDEAGIAMVENQIEQADATVVADIPLLPSGVHLALLERTSNPVVLDQRPIEERNHADEHARRRYEAIVDEGTHCTIAELPAHLPSSAEGRSQQPIHERK